MTALKFSHVTSVKPVLATRLAVMLALQFSVWGVWTVPFGMFLDARGLSDIIGYAYAMQGVAAVVAPLTVGRLADRVVPAQKLMGLLYLGAGLFLFLMPAASHNRVFLLATALAHFLCFVPTLPLANTITMTLIPEPKRNFPRIRAFGTLAWIVVGLLVGLLPGTATSDLPMSLAGMGCIAAAIYSFTLPNILPPDPTQDHAAPSVFGFYIIRHADNRNLRVLLIAAFCAVIPLALYYAYANVFLTESHVHLKIGSLDAGPTALQTVYQMAELALLLPLPILIRRLGTGAVISLGLAAWIGSYALFAYGAGAQALAPLALAIALQGISYSCLFTAGAIYVDSVCSQDECARAQSLFSTLTLGWGPVFGALLASQVFAHTHTDKAQNWQMFWLIPAAISAGVLIYFLTQFRGNNGRGTLGAPSEPS